MNEVKSSIGKIKVSQIGEQLDKQSSCISDLSAVVNRLTSRLELIVLPNTNTQCDDSKDGTEKEIVELAGLLKNNNSNIEYNINKLDDLISRIEL